ncbi:hypothetical protein GCM10009555_083840 [Acrocarpospora macrocephala]|uniref:Uncharacterized protein n=1 Tax=Acrocarpospora macrocephala TaxID=150177 RepID=A0A5M3X032_9ACTN|nr:hypothetical protein [Acrocarpospora macrocephala]GES13499.1 hypothetical protein Amac_070960 [Acrocarpospora macrocephala]
MNTHGEIMPVLAGGTGTAVRLFLATLAAIGAYVGVGIAHVTPERSITLSARTVPAEVAAAPAVGIVSVAALDAGTGCDRSYRVQSVVPPAPGGVSYGWTLQRWSTGERAWQSYLVTSGGFAGDARTLRWDPRVVANPGWYRAVLAVEGDTYRSEKFEVSC